MTLAELEAVVLQLQESVPTLEEQWFTTAVQAWVDGAGALTRSPGNHRCTIMVAPVACRILSVDLSFEYWTLAGSDANYWTGTVEKGSDGTFPDIVTKTTQLTGADANGGITARTAWSFDSGNWSNADLSKGQLLAINWAKTGTPAAFLYPMIATVRYRPL